MRDVLLQYFVGGVIVLILAALKARELREFFRLLLHRRLMPAHAWRLAFVDLVYGAVLVTLAASLFLEPLVPGTVEIKVRAPAPPPTTLDNLILRVVPIGLSGPAGGDRTVFMPFGTSGEAVVSVRLGMWESRVAIDLLDRSFAEPVVQRHSIYVSPFARRSLWALNVNLAKEEQIMKQATLIGMLGASLSLGAWLSVATMAATDLKIGYPTDNARVSGKVIELQGTGADPRGQLEVSVLTNEWYVQNGKATLGADGSWSYGPVYVSGQAEFNNHTIRVTVISNGKRGASATVRGIVRRD